MKKAIQLQDDGNLEWMMNFAAAAGFEYVSIGFHDSAQVFCQDNWEKPVNRIALCLEQYGLKCIQTHLPTPYHPLLSSEKQDAQAEDAIQRCIMASAALDAKWCVCHPRTAVDFAYDKVRSLEDNRKSIEKYLKCAKKCKIGLAVENMPVFSNMPVWYGADYKDLISLVDSFDDELFKVCWDFGHANTAGFDQTAALKDMGNRIRCTHIHDNFKDNDNHFVPYQGSVEWEKVMQQLGKSGYDGALTLEIWYRKSPMLESYLRYSYSCIQYLDQLIERTT